MLVIAHITLQSFEKMQKIRNKDFAEANMVIG